MKYSKFFIKYILVIVFLLNGCAVLSHISGDSTSKLESLPQSPFQQVFDYNVDDCFNKVLAFLKSQDSGVKVLKVNKYTYYILALVSRPTMEDIDGTFSANNADVLILFTPQNDKSTKIEINSLSSLFAEHTADKIFKELNPQQKMQPQPMQSGEAKD
jgi:hypothetical protein